MTSCVKTAPRRKTSAVRPPSRRPSVSDPPPQRKISRTVYWTYKPDTTPSAVVDAPSRVETPGVEGESEGPKRISLRRAHRAYEQLRYHHNTLPYLLYWEVSKERTISESNMATWPCEHTISRGKPRPF